MYKGPFISPFLFADILAPPLVSPPFTPVQTVLIASILYSKAWFISITMNPTFFHSLYCKALHHLTQRSLSTGKGEWQWKGRGGGGEEGLRKGVAQWVVSVDNIVILLWEPIKTAMGENTFGGSGPSGSSKPETNSTGEERKCWEETTGAPNDRNNSGDRENDDSQQEWSTKRLGRDKLIACHTAHPK